jgi:hypothetical protein
MSSILDDFERVTGREPCPVCGRRKYCLVRRDGTSVVCTKLESARRWGEAGWWHPTGASPAPATTWRRGRALPDMAPEVADLADRLHLADGAAAARERLAHAIGVPVEALERLRVGWERERSAWTIPMRDGQRRVVGIQRRFPNNNKLTMRGHRPGWFIPSTLPHDHELVLTEGASDLAAAIGIGLHGIGRYSCTFGERDRRELEQLMRHYAPERVIVISDANPEEQRGARMVVEALRLTIRHVALVLPPPGIKDLRQWTHAGATAGDIRKGAES